MKSARDFFKPMAVGAPKPLTEIPFRPSRMIHFFDPSNAKMVAKVPDIAKKVDVLLGNLEDGVQSDKKIDAREGLSKLGREIDFGETQLWTRVNALNSPWFLDDVVRLVAEIGDKLDVVMVPKVEGPWDIHFVDQLLAQLEAKHGPVLLTTAEHDRDLDLVAGPEEPDDVALLGLVVVLVDLGTKLHLLDDHVRLVAACLTGLLGVLVLELPVVHELAHRGACRRRDLDEVEVGLLGELERFVRRHDAHGLAVGSHEPDLGNPDPVVDSQLGADVSSWSIRLPEVLVWPVRAGVRRRPPLVLKRRPVTPRAREHALPVRSGAARPPGTLRDRTRRPVPARGPAAVGAGGRRISA